MVNAPRAQRFAVVGGREFDQIGKAQRCTALRFRQHCELYVSVSIANAGCGLAGVVRQEVEGVEIDLELHVLRHIEKHAGSYSLISACVRRTKVPVIAVLELQQSRARKIRWL